MSVGSKNYAILGNATENRLGYVLPQRYNGSSLCFTATQTYDKNHSTLDPKLAVMAFALNVWKHYLYRVPYKIYTVIP